MARMLRVDFQGNSYRWFNVDEMLEVHGAIVNELLVEGLAQYFHVPIPFQVLCDAEGPVISSCDIRRALQGLAPRLWLFDARSMGVDQRAKCQKRMEELDLEIGASQHRLADLEIGAVKESGGFYAQRSPSVSMSNLRQAFEPVTPDVTAGTRNDCHTALLGGSFGNGWSGQTPAVSSESGRPRPGFGRQQVQSLDRPEQVPHPLSGRTSVEVILRKTLEGETFGFTNVPEVAPNGRRCLRITKLASSGLLATWNAQHPGKQLCPGDRIIFVNGVSDDLVEMRELLCGPLVRITAEKAELDVDDAPPYSPLVNGDCFSNSHPSSAPSQDPRAERLQHQIIKAESLMSSGAGLSPIRQHDEPLKSEQSHLRRELLERDRRIEELERQLLLWQLSEPKPGRHKVPEWHRPWRQAEARTDDDSVDGERLSVRPSPLGRSPSVIGVMSNAVSPDQYVPCGVGADRAAGQEQRFEEETCKQAKIIHELEAWESREQEEVAEMEENQRRRSEARLIERETESKDMNALRQRAADAAREEVAYQAEILELQKQQLREEQVAIRAQSEHTDQVRELQEWHWWHKEKINALEAQALHLEQDAAQRQLHLEQDAAQRQEHHNTAQLHEIQMQATSIHDLKVWESREQDEVAEMEETERRRSQARLMERENDAKEMHALRQRVADGSRESIASQVEILELQKQSVREQQLESRAQTERSEEARQLQEWQRWHNEKMSALEVQALRFEQDAAQSQEYRKTAQLQELQLQDLEAKLQVAEASQEQLRTRALDNSAHADAQADVQKLQQEQLEQLQLQMQQMEQLQQQEQAVCQAAVAEVLEKEKQIETLRTSEMLEHELALESQLERDSEAKEWERCQARHSQELQAEKQAMQAEREQWRLEKESIDFQAQQLQDKEWRIQQLEEENEQSILRIHQIASQANQVQIQQDLLEPDDRRSEHEYDVNLADTPVGDPDYVAVADDEVDVTLADEIAALGPGILRGNELVRTGQSKYKFVEKKLFLKLIDGMINVRDKGSHVPLAEWLESTLADPAEESEGELMANLNNKSPWAQHMG